MATREKFTLKEINYNILYAIERKYRHGHDLDYACYNDDLNCTLLVFRNGIKRVAFEFKQYDLDDAWHQFHRWNDAQE